MSDQEFNHTNTPNSSFRGLGGLLYLVPSPIGNLADITYRAVEVLKQVDLILAEDTRTTGVLLNKYQIQKPISPYHQHNEHKVVHHLVEQLGNGKRIALLTDAGPEDLCERNE